MKYLVCTQSNDREYFVPYEVYPVNVDSDDNGVYVVAENTEVIQEDNFDYLLETLNEEYEASFNVEDIPEYIHFLRVGQKIIQYDLSGLSWEKDNPFELCFLASDVSDAMWQEKSSEIERLKNRHQSGQNITIFQIVNAFCREDREDSSEHMYYVSPRGVLRLKYEKERRATRSYPSAVITEQEREEVFNAIVETLNRFEYSWTPAGVNRVIDTWLKNKGELIQMMKSHPNYNNNFQIVFSNEHYREGSSQEAGREFTDWICDYFIYDSILVPRIVNGKTKGEWQEIMWQAPPHVYSCYEGEDALVFLNLERYREVQDERFYAQLMVQSFGEEFTKESMMARKCFADTLSKISRYEKDRIDETMKEFFDQNYPEFRVRINQKTTKVVGKFCRQFGIDKIDGYNKAFAKYCDAINIIEVTRHTVLSVHPVDYLTMSFGNSWSSCHTIDKENIRNMPHGYEGMYSSGTSSYMLDKTSMVLYTVDRNYTGTTFYECGKINRCMFHIGNERIVQGRCYPQCNDSNAGLYTQFRNLVQKVVADLWEIPNSWVVRRGVRMLNDIRTLGTHYPDYEHFDTTNMSVYKYTNIVTPTENEMVEIGHKPICFCCGNEHYTQNNINCCKKYICPACGKEIIASIDDDYNDDCVMINDELYHRSCVFWCEYHERYEPISSYCGDVHHYGKICNEAYEDGNFYHCDHCNEVFCKYDLCEHDGHLLCVACREEMNENESD